jgi:hypothetical protein
VFRTINARFLAFFSYSVAVLDLKDVSSLFYGLVTRQICVKTSRSIDMYLRSFSPVCRFVIWPHLVFLVLSRFVLALRIVSTNSDS